MNLQKDLDVFLITYNRKEYLENTLSQMFADNSPIRDLPITILDNCSTDGSTELIEEYKNKFSNITHIRHKKNIGGNANITRAIELAEKKYFWVLCDDDTLHFENWAPLEKAMGEDYDVIFTEISNFGHFKNDASIFRNATFLPSTIYKTELVTEDVLQNAYANIINLFPHLPIIAHAINENKKIFIPEKEVVEVLTKPGAGIEVYSYTRGFDKFIHPNVKNMFWIVGYINSVQLIKDKKKRDFILNNMSCKNKRFFNELAGNFKRNRIYYGNSFKNICDVFCALNFAQRMQFLVVLVWLDIVYFVKKFILKKIK